MAAGLSTSEVDLKSDNDAMSDIPINSDVLKSINLDDSVIVEDEEPNQSTAETNEIREIIGELSRDYAAYLNIDTSNEAKCLNEAIEDGLAHLEEFCNLMDVIRADNSTCLNQLLKEISSKSALMERIYERVDRLEELVEVVKRNVNAFEDEVTKAEELFGSNNKVKKFFASFMNNSKSKPYNNAAVQRRPKFEPPDIFRTSDYIKPTAPLSSTEQTNDDTNQTPADPN